MIIKIGIVDDHVLFTKSLTLLLNGFANMKVIVDAINGIDLQEKLPLLEMTPDVMLVDVNMPEMNGIATTEWLRAAYPTIKPVALSTDDNDRSVMGMIKAGCCSYLLKDSAPEELEKALIEINKTGFYNADALHNNFNRVLNNKTNSDLTENELTLLKYSSTDMTYKEIAQLMAVSPKTLDVWRENLFQKLQVQSRVGLALEAVRRKLIVV